MLMLCEYTAVLCLLVSLAVDCGGWVSAVCVQLVCWGSMWCDA